MRGLTYCIEYSTGGVRISQRWYCYSVVKCRGRGRGRGIVVQVKINSLCVLDLNVSALANFV
jgi:hypothetical protein